ncbi:protein of unknown function DUF58 [Chthoniobacter flavus Ellin428]|uniref:Uncharacterized protein n=1 Tax=Chthoniobacter flavus Ellin428 TaxID=497964 RepID=B4D785_9BACT|nr:DUF58 domain-containing protein [Chthoniobacter flavus]EDY17736.1 protein of unknown function DUF58 [Chthoniobacter flavus Ellin428]TCO87061.1 uncharacterized protein (DUF58 family) [Chthoniobacter flavus]
MESAPTDRVWVWPNGRTLGLAAVLVAMCYAGASQSNGAAYLLCFILTSLAIVSLVHAWANLHGLGASVESIPPVFAGDDVSVPVVLTARKGGSHFGVLVSVSDGAPSAHEGAVVPESPSRLEVRFPSPARGHYRVIPLRITSDYPLGFFTARRRIKVAHEFYVYPTPHGDLPFPLTVAPTRQPRDGVRHEGDDFGGTRLWRPGESQRHIDWKAAARNPVLLTKQWTGETDEILYLDWATLPGLDTETRISQLARWVVTAERGFETYELRLPGKIVRASRGESHFHACLRALASFESPAAN